MTVYDVQRLKSGIHAARIRTIPIGEPEHSSRPRRKRTVAQIIES